MNPKEIAAQLVKNQEALQHFFNHNGKEIWTVQPEGKWSAGQHVIHLVQSTKPLLKALSMPNWLLKWKFGSNNRTNRTFDEVVINYRTKLLKTQGLISPFSNKMPTTTNDEATKWLEELSTLNAQLNKKTIKLKEENLDVILLPHPLMGKMTLREILMWNTYHTLHHLETLQEKYI